MAKLIVILLIALGFVITTLAAKYVRHEDVTLLRWSGVVLITLGAMLVGWSGKAKAPPAAGPGASQVIRT
jgi:drug/metabolite transporter (DMT)-like permease